MESTPDAEIQTEKLIIGCHHKTGTQLLNQILKVVVPRIWPHEKRILIGNTSDRKLPLSIVLKRHSAFFDCYIDQWFEHAVDVAPSGVRFLHFVRHPAAWVRSAYLYHKKGAPADPQRWVEWRVFEICNKKVSYQELLNLIDNETGIFIEAVRSYPEIAGTARAAYTSSHLNSRLQVSLEEIAANFNVMIHEICEFMGLDSETSMEAVQALRIQDIWSKGSNHMPTNVTRFDAAAQKLEQYILKEQSFNKLYADSAAQMGFKMNGGPAKASSILDDAFVDRILGVREHLLMHPGTPQAKEVLRSDLARTVWMPYALQSFGEGGHLMMYEFIQTLLKKC